MPREHLLADLKVRWKTAGTAADPRTELAGAMVDLLQPLEQPLVIGAQRPFVIMLAGVNGAGKTTSIGKLAKWLQQQGLSVLLAAGDTFRAAAREQLTVWGERNNVAVIQQAGGDAASVMFDAIGAARARAIDVVLADTAGRLPTQANLMDELRKIKRVIGKAQDGAPHEVLLVLDANTGQNALAQVRAFDAAVGLTGLILTKLDGSAKGGVVAAIAKQHPIPLKFVGIGEGVDDLRPFVAQRVRRGAAACIAAAGSRVSCECPLSSNRPVDGPSLSMRCPREALAAPGAATRRPASSPVPPGRRLRRPGRHPSHRVVYPQHAC